MRSDNRMMTDSDIGGTAQPHISGSEQPASASRNPSVQGEMPRLRVRALGEWTVVEIVNADFLYKHAAICEVSRQLCHLVDEGHIRLLLDLGGVRSISGEVIAALAGLYRVVHSQHGRLGLFGLEPLFRDTLRICRLDQMLEIYADAVEACGCT